jgi:hypothetical protein
MTMATLSLPDDLKKDLANPGPESLRAAREVAGHSQTQAALAVGLSTGMRWSEYERGVRQIDPTRWALYLLLTDQHPGLRVTRRR